MDSIDEHPAYVLNYLALSLSGHQVAMSAGRIPAEPVLVILPNGEQANLTGFNRVEVDGKIRILAIYERHDPTSSPGDSGPPAN